jgi:hypothetical protein
MDMVVIMPPRWPCQRAFRSRIQSF